MFTRILSEYSGGNCTSIYNVILNREYTVDDFINTILKNYNSEWGYIEVLPHEIPNSQWGCVYRYGELITAPLTSGYLHK